MTPGRVSQKVIAAKLETVSRMLAGIQSLPLASERQFSADPRMVAAGEPFLRRALEAVLDLGRHVLARGFGRGVSEYAAIAENLGEVGVLSPELVAQLAVMARYRNRMVHFYDEIGSAELFGILTTRLGDVTGVVDAIQAWASGHPERVDPAL